MVRTLAFQPGVICTDVLPPQKLTNISKIQLDQYRGPTRKPAKANVAYSLNVVNYLFYLFVCLDFVSLFVTTSEDSCVYHFPFLSCLETVLCSVHQTQ